MRLLLSFLFISLSFANDNLEKKLENYFEENINKVEDKETNYSIKQYSTKNFGLLPFKSSYILPASYYFDDFEGERKDIETIFQFSLQKNLASNIFSDNDTLNVAYTQKSFWQTTADSAPFRETVYEPELFLDFYKDYENLKLLRLSLYHMSNGKDGEESRSANRFYVESTFQFDNLFIIPRVWYRIPERSNIDDNPDFYKYYGYGDLKLIYFYKKHSFDLLLRNNLRFNSQNKGYAEFNWNIPLPKFLNNDNTFFLFQVSHGYGHSFIDYDREVTNIGFGISITR
ncbi:phospholipase A [Arcobacter porcinus]|uniref:phospholipase A n=1 Tax=Arcobacter porcinus TaxID=1935204 RepID=UPI00081D5767|nr:phospholipase A [Arcobacter porcinus]OCL82867.1 Phospholipase A1 precursor [Arcobacter porcinus]